jgi:hypothetical protein
MGRAAASPAPGRAGQALRFVLAAGFLAMLGANLPGQMTYDSVAALHEGNAGVRVTWGPPAYAWMLARFNNLNPGTGLYLAASGLIFFASLAGLRTLRSRTTWWGAPAAILAVLSPTVLVYQGIVWKDVFFANCVLATFVALAHAARSWSRPGPRVLALAAAALFLAMSALVRQNGLIAAPIAAFALGWAAQRAGARLAPVWAAGWLAAALVAVFGLARLTDIPSGAASGLDVGPRILQHYDIMGALARDPAADLGAIAAVDPGLPPLLRRDAVAYYSPQRIDTLGDASSLVRMWALPDPVVRSQWARLALQDPYRYLVNRAEVFRWVFLNPEPALCLPYAVGVEGSSAHLADLGLVSGQEPQDTAIGAYAQRFVGGPAMSHLTWALVAAAVAAVLMLRREPPDIIMASLMAAALAFAASFAVISIACDYRYLYLVDAAALAGLLYVALDPPQLRRGG